MAGRFKKRDKRSSKRDWRKSDNSKNWRSRDDEETLSQLPKRLPIEPGKKIVKVAVEGYGDIPFWRGIFDDFESSSITFEINVPQRADLAKGKKVLLSMIKESSDSMLLCTDSDFDYLFGAETEESRLINNSPYLFQTYVYATENYCCYAPSLHNVCVKATKNDTQIFDFEKFLRQYSETIYPLFLWYAYSAREGVERAFTLIDFKSSVKLNYVEVDDNGSSTIEWLSRQVEKRLNTLNEKHPDWDKKIYKFGETLTTKSVSPQNVYLFMQGHTLMDNVIIIILHAVCEKLQQISILRINSSTKQGQALKNELSNYKNSLRGIRDILQSNENYKNCFLYNILKQDIQQYIDSLK